MTIPAPASDEADQHAASQRSLDLLFPRARTHDAWLDRPVSLALVRRAHDIARTGPTSMN